MKEVQRSGAQSWCGSPIGTGDAGSFCVGILGINMVSTLKVDSWSKIAAGGSAHIPDSRKREVERGTPLFF